MNILQAIATILTLVGVMTGSSCARRSVDDEIKLCQVKKEAEVSRCGQHVPPTAEDWTKTKRDHNAKYQDCIRQATDRYSRCLKRI